MVACSSAGKGISLESGCDFEFKGSAEILSLNCKQDNNSSNNSKSKGTISHSIQ